MQLPARPVRLAALGLTLLALPAEAQPGPFDGVWQVRFITVEGPCGASHASTVAIEGGQIRPAAAGGTSVSGGVRPGGAVTVGISNALAAGNASGRLSPRGGSGTWTVASLGCTGRWTAERRGMVVARAS